MWKLLFIFKIKLRIPVVICWLLLVFLPGGAEAQILPEREPQPEFEENLRLNLRKLDRWGVMQLLRTERDVDKQQIERARLSAHPEELAMLAEDEDGGVRFYVAVNRHTPLDIHLRLANDPLPYVRGGVALALVYDPLASKEVREFTEKIALKLAQDPQPVVRYGLVSNKNLAPAIFAVLARDPDSVIRQKLAENLNLPQSALEIMAEDSVMAVKIQVLKHRNLSRNILAQKSADSSPLVRLAVSKNINTPSTVLERLAGDEDPQVREEVAAHPVTSLEVLRKMADDDELGVVLAVARHPNADRSLLFDLASDLRDEAVRQVAQERMIPILKSEIREDILERWENR